MTACAGYTFFALQNGDGTTGWCCCDNDLSHSTKYGAFAGTCGKTGAGACNYIYEALPALSTETVLSETL
jgi:hypothetical protein